MTSTDDIGLTHDPRPLAAFLAARIADAQQQAETMAALETEGRVVEAGLTAHLHAVAASQSHLLQMHPGPPDRESFCPGCVGPYDFQPTHTGHCPIQLVLARIWQGHPDFPAWALEEPITQHKHSE